MPQSQGRKIRAGDYVEVEWLNNRKAPAHCPNCGYDGEVEQFLAADYAPPGQHHVFNWQVCPRCTVRFVDDMHTMDYGAEALIELGWHSYQAQIGAGLWPIAAPLAALDKPPGARMLEIGGGYGFGLDFGVQARGWQGVGYDPSPLGAFGRQELGLDLRATYFTEAELKDGPWEVVVATEVIEHLPDPPGFLRLMRKALKDDGVLVLTTPDVAWVTEALSSEDLVALISPDAHIILQTAESLRVVLEAAGFAHVQVRREQMSLIAFASPVELALNDDRDPGRADYRAYLTRRAALATPGSDTQLGFAGRELFEAANDGDWDIAEEAWIALRRGVRRRFGFELQVLTELPEGCAEATLPELTARMPLGLGQILFARTMALLGQGEDRAVLRPLFVLVEQAVTALQDALAKRSLGDGLSAVIGLRAREEVLLCDLEAGLPEAVDGVVALGDKLLGWRGFVALVNDGAFALAARLKERLLAEQPGVDVPEGLHRDALLSLANFYLAPGADAQQALAYVAPLRALGENADSLILGAFTRLVNKSRHAAALDAVQAYDVPALVEQVGGTEASDAALALAVLELAVGDPALVPTHLARTEVDPDRAAALILAAFTGLVNAGRYEEAEALAEAQPALQDLSAQTGKAADDARLAAIVLDIHRGRATQAAAKMVALEQAGGDAAALAPYYIAAFTWLVNSGDAPAARALAQDEAVERRLSLCPQPELFDALAALALLDAQPGGDAARLPVWLQRFEDAGADEERVEALTLTLFTALVNGGDFAAATTLLRQVEAVMPKLHPPYSNVQQGALFASGIYYLQDKLTWPRSAACLARLRDDLVRAVPPGDCAPHPLFWAALRGEAVALLQQRRTEEATALIQTFVPAYEGAPDDLLQHLKPEAP